MHLNNSYNAYKRLNNCGWESRHFEDDKYKENSKVPLKQLPSGTVEEPRELNKMYKISNKTDKEDYRKKTNNAK